MLNYQIKTLLFLFIACSAKAQSQQPTKGHLEQGVEYFYAQNQYDQALRSLELLQQKFDLKSVKLDFALNIAVKYKRDELIIPLLEELNADFNTDLKSTEAELGEWLGDSSFNFAGHFAKKWPGVAKRLELKKQQYVDNLKSDYYGTLMNFLNVDQFVRFNEVSASTFKEVDSLNLDMFVAWIMEVPANEHIKSRLNNQILCILLRHLGPARFKQLSDKKIFTNLLEKEIISPQDYGMMYDYLHPNPVYFVKIDAFIERSWDFAGIKTQAELREVDQHRASIGLLPLEYSGYCTQRNVVVPASLKYASPIEKMLFSGK